MAAIYLDESNWWRPRYDGVGRSGTWQADTICAANSVVSERVPRDYASTIGRPIGSWLSRSKTRAPGFPGRCSKALPSPAAPQSGA